MSEDSLITDELKRLIGIFMEPVIYKVEEGAIRRYAEAVGDPNSLYTDVEYASKSRYGRLVGFPGFTGFPVKGGNPVRRTTESLLKAGAPPRVLYGGTEYEFVLPVGAGDILIATSKVTSISEKEGRTGKMLFTTVETTYLNQNGDLTAQFRATYINY